MTSRAACGLKPAVSDSTLVCVETWAVPAAVHLENLFVFVRG